MRRRDPDLIRLLKFEYDECAICGVMDPLHLHHVLLRSHGGDDVRANIVCLCLHCHEGYHARRKQVYRVRLAEHIEQKRPDTVAYLAQKLGEDGCEHWFAVHRSG